MNYGTCGISALGVLAIVAKLPDKYTNARYMGRLAIERLQDITKGAEALVDVLRLSETFSGRTTLAQALTTSEVNQAQATDCTSFGATACGAERRQC